MRKTAGETGIVRTIRGICDKSGGRITARCHVFGQERSIRSQGREPLHAELVRPSAREKAGVGRQRPRGGRAGSIESNPDLRQSLQVRAGRASVALEAQVVGPDRVEHDQENVGRIRRWNGPVRFKPLLHPVTAEHGSCQQQSHSQHNRNAPNPKQHSPLSRLRLDPGRRSDRDSERHNEPGGGKNRRPGDQEHGLDQKGDKQAKTQPASLSRPTSCDSRQDQPQAEKQKHIRQWRQPYEVLAHHVNPMRRVDRPAQRRASRPRAIRRPGPARPTRRAPPLS